MIRSAIAVLGSNMGIAVLKFLRNIALARMLTVSDYGTANTFAVIFALIEMIGYLGLDRLLVQDKNGDTPRMQAVLQAVQVVRGILLALLLFLTALDMLFERRTERRVRNADEPTPDPSVFPLAIPLIAGPGALTTMILLMGESGTGILDMAIILLLMVAVVAIVYLLCLASGWIALRLGPTGIMVTTRLFGMLLAALSVQFVIDGIRQMGLLTGP